MSGLIDIHCHTAGIGAGDSGCFVSEAMRRNFRFAFFLKAFGVTEQEILQHGDGYVLRVLSQKLQQSKHVSSAVVLAMDGVINERGELDRARTECYIPNEFVACECSKYPNLLFGASVNPYRRDALERLERVASEGAILVKWLPSIQMIDPADTTLKAFYRKLSELRMPLLSHTGTEEAFTLAEDHLADPLKLRLALDEGVTVIAAHCASNGKSDNEKNFARFVSLLDEYPNLYADYSSLTQANRIGHLRKILREERLHDRLLYGTDMPLINTKITSPLWHLHRLGPVAALRLCLVRNPWDRDVELKRALGVTDRILRNDVLSLRRQS